LRGGTFGTQSNLLAFVLVSGSEAEVGYRTVKMVWNECTINQALFMACVQTNTKTIAPA
jgi:hypothetical protein